MKNDKLKQIIKECVYKVINEGVSDSNIYKKWDDAQKQLGSDTMLDAIWNYLTSDEIEKIIEYINEDYDLWDDEN